MFAVSVTNPLMPAGTSSGISISNISLWSAGISTVCDIVMLKIYLSFTEIARGGVNINKTTNRTNEAEQYLYFIMFVVFVRLRQQVAVVKYFL
jgi:hypothetical protein